jgi:hypothetical protein
MEHIAPRESTGVSAARDRRETAFNLPPQTTGGWKGGCGYDCNFGTVWGQGSRAAPNATALSQ